MGRLLSSTCTLLILGFCRIGITGKVKSVPLKSGEHRVAWLHIPKTGTSFGVTLAHYANASLPEDATRTGLISMDRMLMPVPAEILDTFFRKLLWQNSAWAKHQSISHRAWDDFQHDFFGMFREPRSWAKSVHAYFGPGERSLKEFMEDIAGTATLMLAGQRFGLQCVQPQLPCFHPEPNVSLALERLNGFAFVGITTEWHRSICLFSLMFQTPCHDAGFVNNRPTPLRRIQKHGTDAITDLEWSAVMAGVDDADQIIYSRALAIFTANVEKHGATDGRCSALCPAYRAKRGL